MRAFQSIWRRGKVAAMGLLGWLIASSPVWAAAAPKQEAPASGGSWVEAYAVVLLGITLGMLALCHSSRRRENIKITAMDDGLSSDE